ncbi:phenazine biosynthesis-like domain-containing protein [Babylonia areolata]|uniref:phenazine biosynthesis-like domain-containing protein n=1 Tax=Babylonia areolata TaxID=304850 RepID=UPI003FD1F4E5
MSGGQRPIPVVLVDTFAQQPFRGSPCPVCLPPPHTVLEERTMKDIAIEFNMAEVAFVRTLQDKDDLAQVDRVGVRWFKPEREVRLCGHGAFATAAVLFWHLGNRNHQVTCGTRYSGDLILRHHDDVITVDFPLGITVRKDEAEYADFMKSLGRLPGTEEVMLCPALKYLLVSLCAGWTRQQFQEWTCDMAAMERAVASSDVIVVIVTMAGGGSQDGSGRPYDFLSRVFVPFSVRPEDPVTGSAQTVLAHYWSQRLGKEQLYTRQCSVRGGEVEMEVEGDRVHVTAHATVVMEGVITI